MPETIPSMAPWPKPPPPHRLLRPRQDHYARRRDHDRRGQRPAQVIAEEDEPEQRHPDWLDLDQRRGDHERALLHGTEHQRCRRDLRQRAQQRPEYRPRHRCAEGSPRRQQNAVKNNSANGSPNRNRTCVAPTVPSVAVSPFCMALRSVCEPAAMTVNTTHSHGLVVIARYSPSMPRSLGTIPLRPVTPERAT